MWKLIVLVVLLSGCSYITYEGKPDGSTVVKGWEIGSTTALSGADFSTTGTSRSLKIDSFNKDQVEGLKQVNQGLSLIVEGAAKGALK